jgi:rhamnose transport system substrate-binding protein
VARPKIGMRANARPRLSLEAGAEESEQVNQQQALALVEAFPNLKGIIIPAGIGLPAAARALEQAGRLDKIKLTGLAPATLIKKYIVAGQCQDIWWNASVWSQDSRAWQRQSNG